MKYEYNEHGMGKLFVGIYFIISFVLIVLSRNRRVLIAFTAGMLLIVFKISESMRIETISEFVDFNAIFLLMGMMVIVAIVRSTGFFQYVAVKALRWSKGNIMLLSSLFAVLIALFSMFLDNVTTMIMFMPVIFLVADAAKFNPFAFTTVMIFASNIGGSMTLVGDPPNIIIGTASKMPFVTFTSLTVCPLAVSFVILIFLSRFSFLRNLSAITKGKNETVQMTTEGLISNPKLMWVSLGVLSAVIVGFVVHNIVDIEMSLFAVLGACFLLFYTNKDFSKVVLEIDWDVILFFMGLFALSYSLESSGIAHDLSNIVLKLSGHPALLFTFVLWVSGGIAMITGAIPVVTIFIPLIAKLSIHYPLPHDLWIALALGANLGGNGTLTGHLANIMCFEMLNKETSKRNTFFDFFKLGFPIAILSIAVSNIYLLLRLIILT